MGIIVRKFGGTSVGTPARIKKIAHRLARGKKAHEQQVLVISAMGHTTDHLVELAKKISTDPSPRELDMLLTAGERISMSLMSLALHNEGMEAISFTGSQSGIITDTTHGSARVLDVRAFRIREELNKGRVVIVAGFQGVSTEKEVTTLGRGGSDTTAVALAWYLDAERCEIFKDVDGVFTADPRIVPNAIKLDEVDYETMLALCYSGSGVLHSRAVEFAWHYGKTIEVKSSFTFRPGTEIKKEVRMEERTITAITGQKHLCEAVYTLDRAGLPGLIRIIGETGIEMFHWDTVSCDTSTFVNLHVILSEINASSLPKPVFSVKLDTGDLNPSMRAGLGAVTLVGLRLRNDMGFMAEMMEFVAKSGIGIVRVTQTHTSVTLFVDTASVDTLIGLLHSKYIVEGT